MPVTQPIRGRTANLLDWTPVRTLLAAAFLCLAASADAATPVQVKRGDLEVKVKVSGTVVADDIFRIKSAIEGRVENITTSTYVWRTADQPLAFLVHRELAAMIDSKGSQNVDILEDRWQRVYRPTSAHCPGPCFILKNFLKLRTWVKPESVMFEAAASLKLVARVRPEDAHWIKDGQEVRFWAVKKPERVLRGRVTKFILDIQGDKVIPGGTFTLELVPGRSLDPGTEWEGLIIPLVRKQVLYVPTGSLVHGGGYVYLPVRVSTGITTQDVTEIAAGVENGRETLILDDSQLFGTERHKQLVIPMLPPGAAPPPDFDPSLGPDNTGKKKKHAAVIEEIPDYGDDPYAEP